MSSPVIGDEAGIPVVANAVLGTPNRESISKASSRTRADWSGAVFMIKRPVLQTGVHVGHLSQAWRRYDRSGDISTNVTAAFSILGRHLIDAQFDFRDLLHRQSGGFSPFRMRPV